MGCLSTVANPGGWERGAETAFFQFWGFFTPSFAFRSGLHTTNMVGACFSNLVRDRTKLWRRDSKMEVKKEREREKVKERMRERGHFEEGEREDEAEEWQRGRETETEQERNETQTGGGGNREPWAECWIFDRPRLVWPMYVMFIVRASETNIYGLWIAYPRIFVFLCFLLMRPKGGHCFRFRQFASHCSSTLFQRHSVLTQNHRLAVTSMLMGN